MPKKKPRRSAIDSMKPNVVDVMETIMTGSSATDNSTTTTTTNNINASKNSIDNSGVDDDKPTTPQEEESSTIKLAATTSITATLKTSANQHAQERVVYNRNETKQHQDMDIDAIASIGIDSSIEGLSFEGMKKKIRSLSRNKDIDGLEKMLAALTIQIDNEDTSLEMRDDFIEIRGITQEYIEILQEAAQEQESDAAMVTNRLAIITAGLDQPMKHILDLSHFRKRVEALFLWYSKINHDMYTAPYFPMIQSSGMGKTRLLMELQKTSMERASGCNFQCFVILCSSTYREQIEITNKFNYILKTVSNDAVGTPDYYVKHRKFIIDQLDKILSATQNDNVVLLFDEAGLMTQDNEGFTFRCVRWWLRIRRTKRKVVAVFTGTTSKLANFYKDPPANTYSRDTGSSYYNATTNAKFLYAPFYSITTIGCYHKDNPHRKSPCCNFGSAAYYGRPLIAYLQNEGKLLQNDVFPASTDVNVAKIVNPQLYTVLKRMLLNADGTTQSMNQSALFSILGTRVQMGMTASFTLASDLVSHGYANLVDFQPYISDDKVNTIAQVAFMPDPVCAALAMGLMSSDWSLNHSATNDDHVIKGMEPAYWTDTAMKLFASGLCLPERGNAGEVMVALYMLFCGDVLRKEADIYMRTFSVPLTSWFDQLISKDILQHSDKENSIVPQMHVSFIQVCRNYVRGNSWNCQASLEYMFHSAVASYTYPDCPAIDMVGSIQVQSNKDVSYRPLLISVKARSKLVMSTVNDGLQSMKDFLIDVRLDRRNKEGEQKSEEIPALCLLLWIDYETPNLALLLRKEYMWFKDCLENDLGKFPTEDTYRLVMVPSDDSFGISNALRKTTAAREIAEIYTSHSFLYTTPASFDANDALRKTVAFRETKDFVKQFLVVADPKLDETIDDDLTAANMAASLTMTSVKE
jgi:hypothetical protein